VDVVVWALLASVTLGLVCFAAYWYSKRKKALQQKPQNQDANATPENPYKISYAPSDRQWSGSSIAALPLKTLTYKQYECLEDARYGFKIVGASPAQRKLEQPHQTRAHGLKTVASLVKHGFLMPAGQETYVITDHGLNALEVCDVRY
jgi:hypothetical protein